MKDAFKSNTKIFDMTIEELKKKFDKFRGNYMDSIERFTSMDERDQKLFILYSLFYFDLKFYRENVEGIVTDEILSELTQLADEFAGMGRHTGCSLNFSTSAYGECFRGAGYKVSVPIKSKTCIKNIDLLNVEDLAKCAVSGYSAENEEEEIFQMLNDKRNKEISAFYQLINTLIKKNIK